MTREATGSAKAAPANAPWSRALVLALALLAIAGFVDVAGFLALGLYPSFLSGDTTQLAIALHRHEAASTTLLAGIAVLFVAGAFLGRLLRLRAQRRAPALWLQAALLAAAALAARFDLYAPALVGAVLAMGVQTTVLTHAGPAAVGATYVTGTLARLGSGLADALAGSDRTGWLVYLLLWAALVAGAVAGAAGFGRAGLAVLALPATASALLAALAGLVEPRGRARA